MPFPEKCNMKRLPKDVKMKPPSGDDDIFTEPPASGQDKEKKRKKSPISPGPEKKRPKKRLARKPKGSTSSRALSPDSLYRLRDESWGKENLLILWPASVLHHEAFLRYQDDLKQLKVRVRELTKNTDAFKLLSEQLEGETKNLHVELEVARKDHVDLVEKVNVFEVCDAEFDSVTDGQNPHVQQKLDRITQLRAEMDNIKAGTDEWRGKMDQLASKKEVVRLQLTSIEIQLRAAKERAEVQTKRVEELQSRFGSAVSDRDNLVEELKRAKLEVVVDKSEAAEMVAQYKADAETAQDQSKNIAEHMKWQFRRQALEEIHA
ncbi:uncharacterized protein [Nicotiana tomentosiformis]|uniref:uncharacterized protein n=1 Tax=Nicotiana tomentosiformis TaxID=4098 RepID=UPI00388CD25A